MRGPKPPAVALALAERRALEALAGAHRTPQQVALRARIVLAAAGGANNAEIARLLGSEVDTARLWRMRWLGLGAVSPEELRVAERLEDAPRPGGPCRVTAAQVCRITALACAAPAASARPIRQWSGRARADAAIKRGIVARLAPRHANRLRQRGWAAAPLPLRADPGERARGGREGRRWVRTLSRGPGAGGRGGAGGQHGRADRRAGAGAQAPRPATRRGQGGVS